MLFREIFVIFLDYIISIIWSKQPFPPKLTNRKATGKRPPPAIWWWWWHDNCGMVPTATTTTTGWSVGAVQVKQAELFDWGPVLYSIIMSSYTLRGRSGSPQWDSPCITFPACTVVCRWWSLHHHSCLIAATYSSWCFGGPLQELQMEIKANIVVLYKPARSVYDNRCTFYRKTSHIRRPWALG